MSYTFSESLNHGRFETWSVKPPIDTHQVTQVHGVDIVSIETLPAEADGMVSSWDKFNLPLAIKTADCLPIVIEGEKGVVFLHAGWRGLADGILKRAEISLIKPQRAFIGPSIHVCCFEVSAEFKDNFKDSPFFKEAEGKLYFDLQQEAKRLFHQDFTNLLVTVAAVCTCCHNELNSYRRDKTKNRNWNLFIKG
jgi:YfiH family protein